MVKLGIWLFACWIFFAPITLFSSPMQQNVETFVFTSKENQRRAINLAKELRCPQCQNQNFIESNSPVAKDLRLIVYQQVEAGLSNDDIINHMKNRYGDLVYYQPPFNQRTAILWLIPALLVMLFVFFIWRKLRR